VVAKSLDAKKYDFLKIEQATKNNLCVDIGPSTVKEYLKILQTSKMIVWNGPLGYFENKILTKNSQNLARALEKLKQVTLIGGGETVELVNRLGLLKQFNFVSTGGGKMMTF
jgi:phosphoglycerate kinase